VSATVAAPAPGLAERPEPAPTLHARLRAETRDLHDAVEREFDWAGRIGTRTGYRALLARWWGFHAVWEPRAAFLLEPALHEPRRKLALLRADLRGLGLADAEIDALPVCRSVPSLRTGAEALGALYVLEGSTLGGQVIARAADEALGLGPEGGCAFFRAYGPRTGAMWRAFRDRLAAVPPAEHESVLLGARATFSCLREWLPAE
jgi:heme oxygenase (biliverdin-IX-beta and delta-forming)